MKQIVLIIGAFYGFLSIILGAFGAHAFKKILSAEKLVSFDTGVRYMMYNALALLAIGALLDFSNSLEKNAARGIILGTFLFSVSIYLLSFSEKLHLPTKVLGPITPIGGAIMIVGWFLLIIAFVKSYK